MKINPFNITKANDYTDEQIYYSWVDMPGGGFNEILKPNSPIPILILGGKGSGKTHIMRFFSYNLQKIRYGRRLLEKISEDGYIGIHMRSSGLNSHRFGGKGQPQEIWGDVFRYYMELWISRLVLVTVQDLFKNCAESLKDKEETICKTIFDLFDAPISIEKPEYSFANLIYQIQGLQKKVDYIVNNIALTGGDLKDLEILVSPGRLIFEIPKILVSELDSLKECQFLYLIDEYENLTELQQKYINTLLREREGPTTFRIGARLYGIRTKETFSANEENKAGSEIEIYNIDHEFRKRYDDYKKLVKKICVTKLNQAGYGASLDKSARNFIDNFFERFSKEKLQSRLETKQDRVSRSYFSKLSRDLISFKIKPEEIVDNLTFGEDRVLERTNVFIFYRIWNKKKTADLLSVSIDIAKSCSTYSEYRSSDQNDEKEIFKATEHHKVLSYYYNDIVDQLCRDSGEPIHYLGLENFVSMSAGIPRNLLIMLKLIYRWSNFNGEEPFNSGRVISQEAQHKGLKEAARWFLDDARLPGGDGEKVQRGIKRLGQFLQAMRFSNCPPECSISSFSINESQIDSDMSRILEYLVQYSYIINVGEKRDKNSDRLDVKYQINGIIAPEWEISIHRRGIPELSSEELRYIFFDNESKKNPLEKRLASYNGPHKTSSPLFD